LDELSTRATGPRHIFATELALRKPAAEDKAYRAANMTTHKRLQFQNCQSDGETDARCWSLADSQCVTNQLESEIYDITSNDQMRFKKEFSLCFIEFEAWLETFAIQALLKTIKQCVFHFGYPKMHVVSHISESIRRMGYADNFLTDIAERLYMPNMKEAYRPSNQANYIRQMLMHNDRCTGLEYMEETLSYLALQGWYDID